jgi:hypothetical protein
MHMGSNELGAYYDKTGKGQRYLSDAVVDEQKNWPTPQTSDTNGAASSDRPAHRKQLRDVEHGLGLPAPANPSTDGSRQELSEQSQRNWQTFAHGTHNRGETPHRQVVKALVNGEKAQTQCLTVDQVFAEEIKGTNMWRTPSVAEEKNQNTLGLELQKQWGTPTARDHKSGRGNEEREYKELTPMVERTQNGKLNPRWVETLMGLPVGWTMPSCASPVTIGQTNCASL